MFNVRMSNISMAAEACITGRPVTAFKQFFPVFTHIATVNMFFAPLMHCVFPSLSDEQRAIIGGYGLRDNILTKTWEGTPDCSVIGNLFQLGVKDGRQIPGTVSFSGYVAYIFSLKAMRLYSFLSTAAVKVEGVMRTTLHPDGEDMKTTGVDNDLPLAMEDSSTSRLQKVTPVERLLVARQEPLFMPLFSTLGIRNMDCSPVSRDLEMDGLVFPYFNGLMMPDRDFVIPVFQRLFFRCLGSNQEKATNMWRLIKRGLRNIAPTQAGMAITHAFLGIVLSENALCPIRFVVTNGQYKGFVLQGQDFSIVANNTVFLPVSTTDVQTDLEVISSHDLALSRIIEVLRSCTMSDGSVRYDVRFKDVATSRDLFNTFAKIDWGYIGAQMRAKIPDYVEELNFGERWATINVKTVLDVLVYVQTGNRDILKDYPAYLNRSNFTDEARINHALMIFGPFVPSINIGTSKDMAFSIPKPDIDDGNLAVENGIRKLQSIPYKLKNFTSAVVDWTQLLNKGVLYIPLPRKGNKEFSNAKARDGQFSPKDSLALYGKVKETVNYLRSSGAGRKRKGEAVAGPSKRMRNVDQTEMEF
jgi:hypothetical protein